MNLRMSKKLRLLTFREFLKCWIKLYTENSLQLFENLYGGDALMLGYIVILKAYFSKGNVCYANHLRMQTMETPIWAIGSTSKGRGARAWKGGFAKV